MRTGKVVLDCELPKTGVQGKKKKSLDKTHGDSNLPGKRR